MTRRHLFKTVIGSTLAIAAGIQPPRRHQDVIDYFTRTGVFDLTWHYFNEMTPS